MILRVGALLLAVMLLAGCSEAKNSDQVTNNSSAEKEPPATLRSDKAELDQKEKMSLASLSKRAGDLIITKLSGPDASDTELAAIRSNVIGGVIFFGWNVQNEKQLRALTSSLQASRRNSQLPLLVSVDQEGGSIRNVPFAPPNVSQMQLGKMPVENASKEAFDTGKALSALGINVILGPVADLASGPNQTMTGRAFSSDPSQAKAYVSATVKEFQRGGVAATSKHFPGFGSSSANSDEAVAYVDKTLSELTSQELVPFTSAIDANSALVMVSHGIYRKLGSTLPGTVDSVISTDLLRKKLGYKGVSMTDSMNAKGFREAWGDTVPKACPAALKAGIDLLLLTGSLETATLCRRRIVTALADGSLSKERVEQALCRVDALRKAIYEGKPELTIEFSKNC